MRLLLVELDPSGHRLALHASLIARSARARGWSIDILTSRKAIAHPAFALLAPFLTSTHVVEEHGDTASGVIGILPELTTQIRHHRAVAEAFRSIPASSAPDHVYAISFENFLIATSLLGSPFAETPFSGMYMGISFHLRLDRSPSALLRNWAREGVFRRVLRVPSLKFIATIDQGAYEFCELSRCNLYSRMRFVPDVGLLSDGGDRARTRRRLQIPDDAFVILCYGSQSPRKGLRELLHAVDETPSVNASVLVVGKPDAATEAILDSQAAAKLSMSGRLRTVDSFVDGDEEAHLFAASDAVWLGYTNFLGSSGVLYQAGAARRPVLSTDRGVIGQITRRYNTGITFKPESVLEVSSALQELAKSSSLRTSLGANGHRLSQLHTGETFSNAVCDAIAASRQ